MNFLTGKKWNNGDLAQSPIKMERANARYEVRIKSDIDNCFSLVCPKAELSWIDGWQFDMVFSESGKNENNCIFMEALSGLAVLHSPGLNTYWYTTLYDPENHRCHFVLWSQKPVIAKLEIHMDALPDGTTLVKWDLTYTALTQEGNKIIREKDFTERMSNMINFLGLSAQHYMETGKIYKLPRKRKFDLALSIAGARVKRHFHHA